MSFLDELKQEAAAKHAQSDGQERPQIEKPSAVAPLLRAIHRHLFRLAAHLNKYRPDVSASYDVQGYGRLSDLKQADYVAEKSSDASGEIVRLRFDCHGEEMLSFWTSTALERDIQKSFLEHQGLHFRIEQQDEWRYGFSVDPFVPVSYTFQPHPKQQGLLLTVRNYERLGETRYSIEADRVKPALLDALARHVVRKANRFDELAGFTVSGEVRRQLQERVARRNMKREAEVKRGGAELPASQGAGRREKKAAAPQGPPPSYAWVVTGDPGGDTAATLGRIGPAGATRAFNVRGVLSDGHHFRLRDAEGLVRFMGQIAGQFRGHEPLEDFGRNHGCVSIEYDHHGEWKTPEQASPQRADSA